jgi:hypothetical protein
MEPRFLQGKGLSIAQRGVPSTVHSGETLQFAAHFLIGHRDPDGYLNRTLAESAREKA